MIDVLTLRGTGEGWRHPGNLLCEVTDRLDKRRFHPIDVDYPASIGFANPNTDPFGVSESTSIRHGVDSIAAAIAATPNLVILLGYSLGAMVVTRYLEEMQLGGFPRHEVLAAGLVANPLRNPGDSWDAPRAPGHGIAGRHGRWPRIRTWEVAHPGDGITCCPENSPLRTVSDALSGFTFAVGGGWSTDLVDRLLAQRWQLATWEWWRNPLNAMGRYQVAADLVDGYVRTGQHMAAYVTGGYLARLADAINLEIH